MKRREFTTKLYEAQGSISFKRSFSVGSITMSNILNCHYTMTKKRHPIQLLQTKFFVTLLQICKYLHLLLTQTVHVLQSLFGPSLLWFQTVCWRVTYKKKSAGFQEEKQNEAFCICNKRLCVCVWWLCFTFSLCQSQLQLCWAVGQLLLQLKDLLLLRLTPALHLLHLTHNEAHMLLCSPCTFPLCVLFVCVSYFILKLDVGFCQVLDLSEEFALSDCTFLHDANTRRTFICDSNISTHIHELWL